MYNINDDRQLDIAETYNIPPGRVYDQIRKYARIDFRRQLKNIRETNGFLRAAMFYLSSATNGIDCTTATEKTNEYFAKRHGIKNHAETIRSLIRNNIADAEKDSLDEIIRKN